MIFASKWWERWKVHATCTMHMACTNMTNNPLTNSVMTCNIQSLACKKGLAKITAPRRWDFYGVSLRDPQLRERKCLSIPSKLMAEQFFFICHPHTKSTPPKSTLVHFGPVKWQNLSTALDAHMDNLIIAVVLPALPWNWLQRWILPGLFFIIRIWAILLGHHHAKSIVEPHLPRRDIVRHDVCWRQWLERWERSRGRWFLYPLWCRTLHQSTMVDAIVLWQPWSPTSGNNAFNNQLIYYVTGVSC